MAATSENQKNKPQKSWVMAFEALRKKKKPHELGITKKKVKEVSQMQMQELGIIGAREYRGWLKGQKGPTLTSLMKWIYAMGYTWNDWAEEIEKAEALLEGRAVQSKSIEYPGNYSDKTSLFVAETSDFNVPENVSFQRIQGGWWVCVVGKNPIAASVAPTKQEAFRQLFNQLIETRGESLQVPAAKNSPTQHMPLSLHQEVHKKLHDYQFKKTEDGVVCYLKDLPDWKGSGLNNNEALADLQNKLDRAERLGRAAEKKISSSKNKIPNKKGKSKTSAR